MNDLLKNYNLTNKINGEPQLKTKIAIEAQKWPLFGVKKWPLFGGQNDPPFWGRKMTPFLGVKNDPLLGGQKWPHFECQNLYEKTVLVIEHTLALKKEPF